VSGANAPRCGRNDPPGIEAAERATREQRALDIKQRVDTAGPTLATPQNHRQTQDNANAATATARHAYAPNGSQRAGLQR